VEEWCTSGYPETRICTGMIYEACVHVKEQCRMCSKCIRSHTINSISTHVHVQHTSHIHPHTYTYVHIHTQVVAEHDGKKLSAGTLSAVTAATRLGGQVNYPHCF
jgi:hypothetical protein